MIMSIDNNVGKSLHKTPMPTWALARNTRFSKSYLTQPDDQAGLTNPMFSEIRLDFGEKFLYSRLDQKVIAGNLFATFEKHTGSNWAVAP